MSSASGPDTDLKRQTYDLKSKLLEKNFPKSGHWSVVTGRAKCYATFQWEILYIYKEYKYI